MDYSQGYELWHNQWRLIHSPNRKVFGWLQDEEEGEVVADEKVKGKWKNIIPSQLFENRKLLKYNKMFIFDDHYIKNSHRLFQLENGDRILDSPKDVQNGTERVYKIKYVGTKEWVPLSLLDYEQYCLKCELEEISERFIGDVVLSPEALACYKIAGGLIAVVLSVPTGGGSLTVLPAIGVSFSIISGLYSTVSGMAELTLVLSNQEELIKKIPSGYLNATIGVTIEYFDGNTKRVKRIKATLNIAEGVATFKLPASDLELLDRAITTGKIVKVWYDEFIEE